MLEGELQSEEKFDNYCPGSNVIYLNNWSKAWNLCFPVLQMNVQIIAYLFSPMNM